MKLVSFSGMTVSLQNSDVCSFAATDPKRERRLQILDDLGCDFTGHEALVPPLSVEEVGTCRPSPSPLTPETASPRYLFVLGLMPVEERALRR